MAVPDDVTGLHALMGSMSNSMELQQAFLHSVGEADVAVTTLKAVSGMAPCQQ